MFKLSVDLLTIVIKYLFHNSTSIYKQNTRNNHLLHAQINMNLDTTHVCIYGIN